MVLFEAPQVILFSSVCQSKIIYPSLAKLKYCYYCYYYYYCVIGDQDRSRWIACSHKKDMIGEHVILDSTTYVYILANRNLVTNDIIP